MIQRVVFSYKKKFKDIFTTEARVVTNFSKIVNRDYFRTLYRRSSE